VKGYWDNLRPIEKRMVVGIATMLFVVLNAWFVFPHFSDWGLVKQRMAKAQKTLHTYETEIRQKPFYEEWIKKLQGGDSQPIPLEDQTGSFADTIRSQADATHVRIVNFGRIVTRTNDPFFSEQTATITVVSKEQSLVDFLYNLGSFNSFIRVRDLTLRPEMPARQELNAGIKLVASYQKKAPARSAPATQPGPAKAPAPAPSTAPASKSAAPATKQQVPAKKPIVPGSKPATNKPPESTTKRTSL
jgi:hypothetical protein